MYYSFFALAAQSPGRQETFRQAVLAHLLVTGGSAWAAHTLVRDAALAAVILGNVLLIAGIVEGAFLIGWRLTQLPKSKALEFLLASPLQPRRLFLAEALVGLARLVFVNLAGLPVLLLLTVLGRHDSAGLTPQPPALAVIDLVPLLVMPITWGAVTGLGLTFWAYEPRSIRRWAERGSLVLVILYLVVGVLIGEKLFSWLSVLPKEVSEWLKWGFYSLHVYNPFAVMDFWMRHTLLQAEDRMLGLEVGALAAAGLMIWRTARRLKPHFDELHYRPFVDESRWPRGRPGDRPLSWWAVRRVMEYSGRINLWLAAGFGTIYAIYTVAGPYWPAWLGKGVFLILEWVGGIPGVATALVVLAAVPAAFQYGLWDSNAQERCRRLELLLLTRLDAYDYWHAAASAAWRRGRGYFIVAMLLWLAAAIAGKIGVVEALAALAAAVVLWCLFFVLGFRAFSRGMQANRLGVLLTLGLPLLSFVLFQAGRPVLATLLPPGSVYAPAAGMESLYWLPGPLLCGVLALILARQALASCEEELRRWYELHHGRKVME